MQNRFGNTAAIASVTMVAALVAGCGTSGGNNQSTNASHSASAKVIKAVGAENEYANVIQQIGGKYVSVTAIMSNPSTDPHDYEASTKDAAVVGAATLIVQNGVGYDDFMGNLESSAPNSNRAVINVADALHYGKNTKNPHLWYQPNTMPKVAQLIANELAKQDPSEKSYFNANVKKFDDSLKPWKQELATLKSKFPNTGVAVTEPVADYFLQASGMDIKTPWSFQAAIMNGVDPSPQDVKTQEELFNDHKIKVFLYNQQAITDVTKKFLSLAKKDDIPVVGVYETMPLSHTYQSWMEAEAKALENALENGKSTETIS
ncbi:metal ABC transporter solute-binding protein, Zn/Mn family [Alicyclobacillus fodiniaquatilis]|uniref:Metal ABC transporter solute-binding protein, Zn/Mn family n=1 Tax=Alicyclobacillus fodiniaquatilis TaxID=1661150 RepID=A0ABW4JP35_9BACL